MMMTIIIINYNNYNDIVVTVSSNTSILYLAYYKYLYRFLAYIQSVTTAICSVESDLKKIKLSLLCMATQANFERNIKIFLL